MIEISIQDQKTLCLLAYKYPGFRPLIRDFIIDSYWAYQWALNIGDGGIMRERVKGSLYENLLDVYCYLQ